MILIIDNYDSFTYNLYQYVGEITTQEILVVKNDKVDLIGLKANKDITHIIISPGPKGPKQAGQSMEVVRMFFEKIPILGVCLGHQVIGEVFGAKIVGAKEILHGKASPIYITKASAVFRSIKEKFIAGRYHSLIVEKDSLPDTLEVIAVDEKGEIMALAHKKYLVYGLQFHPESILTPVGKQIIKNFLEESYENIPQ